MRRNLVLVVCAAMMISTMAQGGVVVFKNGDKITGAVQTLDGGKLKITSAVAGDITVDMKDVQTFSTDAPARIKTNEGERMKAVVATSDTAGSVATNGKQLPITAIKTLDATDQKWTGSVLVNGLLTQGNSHTEQVGVDAAAQLRRNDDQHDDRFTGTAGYNFGRQKAPGASDSQTSLDNWYGQLKYDVFFTEKWYGYGTARAEHDRIAELYLRLTPGVGVGYQWAENPDFHFFTEAGVNFINEDYNPGPTDNRAALRLAYHVDKTVNEKFSVFHNVEFLPAFENPGDYLVTADAGVRATLTKTFYTELKIQLTRDSTPAPGAQKNDLRYVLGVGWQF